MKRTIAPELVPFAQALGELLAADYLRDRAARTQAIADAKAKRHWPNVQRGEETGKGQSPSRLPSPKVVRASPVGEPPVEAPALQGVSGK